MPSNDPANDLTNKSLKTLLYTFVLEEREIASTIICIFCFVWIES